MQKQIVIGVIPARFASTRLPGKMLADIRGQPLLWHTWHRALQSKRLDRLVIAAGDARIAEAARCFGAEVVEVFDDVQSGSDRVWKAVQKLQIEKCVARDARCEAKSKIIVNIQGDEPMLDPLVVDAVVETLLNNPQAGVGTAASPLIDESDYLNPACVKVIIDKNHRALYFSRSPIPYGLQNKIVDKREARCVRFEAQSKIQNPKSKIVFRHIGIYAYRYETLQLFTQLPPSQLELTERLEQLRLLEQGVKFAAAIVDYNGIAVDTADDLARVRRHLDNY